MIWYTHNMVQYIYNYIIYIYNTLDTIYRDIYRDTWNRRRERGGREGRIPPARRSHGAPGMPCRRGFTSQKFMAFLPETWNILKYLKKWEERVNLVSFTIPKGLFHGEETSKGEHCILGNATQIIQPNSWSLEFFGQLGMRSWLSANCGEL